MNLITSLFKHKQDWYPAPTNTNGMTKFTVACDLHIGSKYQDNPNALAELYTLKNDGMTILNGDIFDRACAKPKDVPYLTSLMNFFINKFCFYSINEKEFILFIFGGAISFFTMLEIITEEMKDIK